MKSGLCAIVLPLVFAVPAAAAGAPTSFVTLGTGSGPSPQKARAQPANLLRSGNEAILIDCGDGATQQLGKAGVPLARVHTVFLSHLHFDHIGGLFALISRRYQLLIPTPLTIYGPRGTKATVRAMVAAMTPALASWSSIRSKANGGPDANIKVVELRDGWTGRVGAIGVTAVTNTHFATMSEGPTKQETYAFRFDAPDRSIVYTGDTGPSEAVVKLANGADVLFSEIMDPEVTVAELRASRLDVPPQVFSAVEAHHRLEHLSPDEVGKLAERAHVKALVLTHNALPADQLDRAKSVIGRSYKGRMTFAADLQSF